MSHTKKIIFIDRDGTINVEKNYVHQLADLEFIAGSTEALQQLSRAGHILYIITNQAGIAKGLYTEKQFHDFSNAMLGILKESDIRIEKILYCPHHPEATVSAYRKNCLCRKPGTALLEQALAEQKMDAVHGIVIGDRNSDIDAGLKLGMQTLLVETGYGAQEKSFTKAHHIVKDLHAAVQMIEP